MSPCTALEAWSLGRQLVQRMAHFTGRYPATGQKEQSLGQTVGGVVGVVVGAYEPIQEQEQSVRDCLSEKGYVLRS